MFAASWVIMVLHGYPRSPEALILQDTLLLLIACYGLQWGSVSVHISFLLLCNRLIAHSLLSTVVDMHDACATPTSLA